MTIIGTGALGTGAPAALGDFHNDFAMCGTASALVLLITPAAPPQAGRRGSARAHFSAGGWLS